MTTYRIGWRIGVVLALLFITVVAANRALTQEDDGQYGRQELSDYMLTQPVYWAPDVAQTGQVDDGTFGRQALADYMLTQPVYVAPDVEPAIATAPR